MLGSPFPEAFVFRREPPRAAWQLNGLTRDGAERGFNGFRAASQFCAIRIPSAHPNCRAIAEQDPLDLTRTVVRDEGR